MNKLGFYQIIHNQYKTSTNKDRVKLTFIFLEELITTSSMEEIEKTKEIFKRYKNYSNVTILQFDKKENAYIFHKNRNTTLKLNTTKGVIQNGERVKVVQCVDNL